MQEKLNSRIYIVMSIIRECEQKQGEVNGKK